MKHFSTTAAALLSITFSPALWADHPCSSPLVLDFDGNGRVDTTSKFYGVVFDINADGKLDRIGWTHPEMKEAFLWLDLNGNDEVDDGSELFGTATLLPSGKTADNGFEALGQYDEPTQGGNLDGAIDPNDAVWPHLRLWIDSNHDARVQRDEQVGLDDHGVARIGLQFTRSHRLDGGLNVHAYEGIFLRHVTAFGRTHLVRHRVTDVVFATYSPFDDEKSRCNHHD